MVICFTRLESNGSFLASDKTGGQPVGLSKYWVPLAIAKNGEREAADGKNEGGRETGL